jgi:hypothetical protein
MIIPGPPLLSSSPPPSEPHTRDAQDDESEDSLPRRKRYRGDMSEDTLDRVFHGLNDILQRNERLKAQAKKKHKKLDLMEQRRGLLPSDASVHTPDSFAIMSDFESRLDYREKEGIVDYKLIISCRLFANGKMVLQDKPCDDPLRYSFDDLAPVENCFDKLVRTHLKMDGFTYDVTGRQARISSTCGKGKAQLAMFEDFDFATLDLKVLAAADSFMKAYPTNKAINLQFEQKITYDAKALHRAQADKSKQQTAAATDSISSPVPTTAGAVSGPIHRSDKLMLQHNARLDKEMQIGTSEGRITLRWQCRNSNCSNHNSICYVMPGSGDHYAVSTLDHRRWATMMEQGEGSIDNPPGVVLGALIQQGAIGREGRRPNQQPGKKSTTDQMADMQSMVQNSMGMMLNMRMMDMMGNMMGSMGNSTGNYSIPTPQYIPQPYPVSQVPAQPYYHHIQPTVASHVPQRPVSPGISRETDKPPSELDVDTNTTAHRSILPAKQGYATQQSVIPSSSPPPIMPDRTADDTVKDFFQWRINGLQAPDKRIKWRTAGSIANKNDWSLDDLRAMADSTSHQYQLAIKSGISDGIARSFLKEIRAFKSEMKKTIDAVSVLAGTAVSGGGFIPPIS